jgi:hypothetical protein
VSLVRFRTGRCGIISSTGTLLAEYVLTMLQSEIVAVCICGETFLLF